MTRRTPAHAEWLASQRGDGGHDHGEVLQPATAPTVEALRGRIAAMEARGRAGAQQPRAAPDAGRILARLARTDGTELRVSLHRYEGKPFVRVGPWQSSSPDAWPVKGKGCTVKVRELATVAAALLDAADAANSDE